MINCKIIHGDSRRVLDLLNEKVDLIVTSPPYADARKNHYDSISPDGFCDWFQSFHRPFWNVLEEKGSLVINIKDKVVKGVRHRFVWKMIMMLEDLGWHCIDDYIWHKTSSMPGYWPTRLRDAWEYCFHLAKTIRPFINQEAVKKPIGDWAKKRLAKLSQKDSIRRHSRSGSGFGSNLSNWTNKKMVLPSNVLSLSAVGRNRYHPAAFPIDLPRFFIKLLSPENGTVLDPFGGVGSTSMAAILEEKHSITVDKNYDFCKSAHVNIQKTSDKNTDISFLGHSEQ